MMTYPASTASKHPEQSRHYRDLAIASRDRLAMLEDDELYTELYLLAVHYERLAAFADSSGSLGSFNARVVSN
jgi:hypothetical protein